MVSLHAEASGRDALVTWRSRVQLAPSDLVTVSCGPVLHLGDYLDAKLVGDAQHIVFKNLPNLGCEYVFTYVTLLGGNKAAMASTSLDLHGFLQPRGGHIALADAPDEMWVSFTTFHQDTPVVVFGKSSHDLNLNATGTAETPYTADDMCNAPANQTGQRWFVPFGNTNHVKLRGLEPGTVYYYRFGTHRAGMSKVHSFTSPLPAGQGDETRFIVYADMGVGLNAASVGVGAAKDVRAGYNHFLLHAGDISYARGSSWAWEAWFEMMEGISTRLPYMVSIGNHEYDHIGGGEHDPSGAAGIGFHPAWGNMGDDSNGECSVPMFHRYRTPSNGKALYWYSFDYGLVHVVQMSSEHDWTQGSEQYQWLDKDLASVNRTLTPWVVLTSHRMMYTTQLKEDGDWKVSIQFRKELDGLIHKHKVNLMMTGHQHSYERSCPVFEEECVASGQAPVHVIMGTAGAGLENGGFSPQFGNWSVFHEEDHWGYTRLRATRTALSMEYVATLKRGGKDIEKREVLDSVTLQPWF